MELSLLPYAFLFTGIVFCLLGILKLGKFTILIAIIFGVYFQRIELVGLVWMGLLRGSLYFAQVTKSDSLKALCYTIITVLVFGFAQHLLPGFNNLKVLNGARFSTDSVPYTMYLNFDKTIAGVLLFLYFVIPRQSVARSREHLLTAIIALITLVAVILLPALQTGYVRFDPKLPGIIGLWALNNLLFVCLAEEAIFRGYIQKGLINFASTTKLWNYGIILFASVLFGLAHYAGGVVYVALSTLAGAFYGFTYYKTGKLQYAMLVHFGLNLTHFLLFSYPALAKH